MLREIEGCEQIWVDVNVEYIIYMYCIHVYIHNAKNMKKGTNKKYKKSKNILFQIIIIKIKHWKRLKGPSTTSLCIGCFLVCDQVVQFRQKICKLKLVWFGVKACV